MSYSTESHIDQKSYATKSRTDEMTFDEMSCTQFFHGCKNENFQLNFFYFFHIFAQNIYSGYTLEPPHGTAQLISAFVFAIRIAQSLYYLNPKFQASSHLLSLYSPVCVGPEDRFSHKEAHICLASFLWDIGKQKNASSQLGLFC